MQSKGKHRSVMTVQLSVSENENILNYICIAQHFNWQIGKFCLVKTLSLHIEPYPIAYLISIVIWRRNETMNIQICSQLNWTKRMFKTEKVFQSVAYNCYYVTINTF